MFEEIATYYFKYWKCPYYGKRFHLADVWHVYIISMKKKEESQKSRYKGKEISMSLLKIMSKENWGTAKKWQKDKLEASREAFNLQSHHSHQWRVALNLVSLSNPKWDRQHIVTSLRKGANLPDIECSSSRQKLYGDISFSFQKIILFELVPSKIYPNINIRSLYIFFF